MRTLLFVAGLFLLAFGCKKCEDRLEAETLKHRMASGTQTYIFKSPSGDTLYSTNFVAWGYPRLGGITPNGYSSKAPIRWYYGDALDWESCKDDKFHQNINPNCILVGIKQKQ